jgi:hypothetical protein
MRRSLNLSMMLVDGDAIGGSFLKFTSMGETDRSLMLLGVGGLEGIGDFDLGE